MFDIVEVRAGVWGMVYVDVECCYDKTQYQCVCIYVFLHVQKRERERGREGREHSLSDCE